MSLTIPADEMRRACADAARRCCASGDANVSAAAAGAASGANCSLVELRIFSISACTGASAAASDAAASLHTRMWK